MGKWIRAALAALLLAGHAHAQTAGQQNEGLSLARDPVSGAFTLSWWAEAGRTYFIQESSDLLNWSFMPLMESASDQVISWGATTTATQLFFRLQYTDTSFTAWETQAGLDPLLWTDPTSLAPSGNGATILQCYQQSIDPYDWFSGQTVVLTVISGDGQTAPPATFLTQPIVVSVTKANGSSWPNAPVTFFADLGVGGFASANDGTQTPSETLTVEADFSGLAQVYFQPLVSVAASGYATASSQQVSFTVNGYDPDSAPSMAPILTTTSVSATQTDLSWVNKATNGTGTVIQRWTVETGWVTIATVGAGVTTFSDTSVPQGELVGYSVATVNTHGQSPSSTAQSAAGGNLKGDTIDPTDPDLTQPHVPEANYAVIDLTKLGFVNPAAINDSLQILDNPKPGDRNGQARLWTAGTFTPIPDPRDPSDQTTPLFWLGSMSNDGMVIDGQYVPSSSRTQGVVDTWSPKSGAGKLASFSTGPQLSSYPFAGYITPGGAIVGHSIYYTTSASYEVGLLWSSASAAPVNLGDIIDFAQNPGTYCHAWGANDSGIVVGDAQSQATGGFYAGGPASYWSNGSVGPALGDGNATNGGDSAFSVNNISAPIAVGYVRVGSDNRLNAVMWANVGGVWKQKDLGSQHSQILGGAWKINDRCEILADFSDASYNRLGYFWQNAKIVNFESRISGGYTDFYPISINNNGAILAWATRTADGQDAAVLLLPAEVAVRKQGTTAAPVNGLVVNYGDALDVALAPSWFDQTKQFDTLIAWQYRQLKADGTYTEWTKFPGSSTGTVFTYTPSAGGIFQFEATVTTNGKKYEYPYLRRTDDQFSRSTQTQPITLKKGDPDAIGVVDDPIQIAIVTSARADLGGTDYAQAVPNPPFGANTDKCNLFVAHKAGDAHATVPWFNGTITHYPPVANQWAGVDETDEGGSGDPDWPYYIPEWYLLQSGYPQPGYMFAHPNPGGIGHCGLVDYDGRVISAGPFTVNRLQTISPGVTFRYYDDN